MKSKDKYKELVSEDAPAYYECLEHTNINRAWDRFLEGKIKTLGVENIYPILLDIENEDKKRDRFIRLKTHFKELGKYAKEAFNSDKVKQKFEDIKSYSNEPSTLRVYSLLNLIGSLGGYKPDTWVSKKELAIAGHMSNTSVQSLSEALYSEKIIEKQQETKRSATRGSILHQLNKRSKEILGKTDSFCYKKDKESWQGFKDFLNSRMELLNSEGYIDNITKESKYSSDKVTLEKIIYVPAKLEPSRKYLGKVKNRVIVADS